MNPEPQHPTFAGVVLAGGQSTRMGRDKAFLEWNGEPLLRRQLELLRQIGCTNILISGRADVDYSSFGVQVVHDPVVNAGPLSGITAAMRAASAVGATHLLVLAVDTPCMTLEFMQALVAACTTVAGAIPIHAKQLEPLAAVYPVALLPVAERCLSQGKLSVQGLARAAISSGQLIALDIRRRDLAALRNVNDPTELQDALDNVSSSKFASR